MSEKGEIYTAGKNFTLPAAVTEVTNFTSGVRLPKRRNVRKHSKQPLTPPSHFRKIILQFFSGKRQIKLPI